MRQLSKCENLRIYLSLRFYVKTFFHRMYVTIEPLQKSLREIDDLMSYKNYQPAIDRLTEIVEVYHVFRKLNLIRLFFKTLIFAFQYIPWNSHIRELRADAYLGIGNTMHAISEMRALTKLTTDNTEGFFKLSTLHYQVKMKSI